MHPWEFWDLCACEVIEFVEEATKGQWTDAWRQGLMTHYDPQKYPKRPDLLWDKYAEDQTFDQLKTLAIAWASNGQEIAEK